jgi:hypothetical protein
MDWTDPNTWKLPAALIDYWRTILGGVVVIGGALYTILRWGVAPVRWIWSQLAKQRRAAKPSVARPLRFVQSEQRSFWGPAGMGQQQGTQVSGHWHVTNMSDRNVVLLRARLDGYVHSQQHVGTSGFRDKAYPPIMPVPAGKMAQVTADLIFFPSIISSTGPLVADVIFTDNYEEEHRVPSRFRFIRA